MELERGEGDAKAVGGGPESSLSLGMMESLIGLLNEPVKWCNQANHP